MRIYLLGGLQILLKYFIMVTVTLLRMMSGVHGMSMLKKLIDRIFELVFIWIYDRSIKICYVIIKIFPEIDVSFEMISSVGCCNWEKLGFKVVTKSSTFFMKTSG